ncbi:10439_t:CDS:1, partial [Paraglomus brasilianum]
VGDKVEGLQIQCIIDETTLNKAWHKLNLAIKQAANNNIKNKLVVMRGFEARTKKASILHKALVKINKVMKYLKELKQSLNLSTAVEGINKKLEKISEMIQCGKMELIEEDLEHTNIQKSILKIKEIRRLIHKCRQEENNSEIREEIAEAIERRENNLQANTKKMIDSVLKRRRARVEIENIKKGEELLVEAEKIKEEVRAHFRNWTRENKSNWDFWEEWKAEYEPKKEVKEEQYESLIKKVEMQELMTTIAEAGSNKAMGPDDISNEMIKQLPQNVLEVLLEIINFAIDTGITPKAWSYGLVYPIGKKETFDGDLRQTRPITLIGHARKIMTKLLTIRLNRILVKTKILNPKNNSALPHTSTAAPISWLANIQEDAWLNKKDF